LVALAAPVVLPGGYLIACTNYEQLPQRGFVSRVREGLAGVAAKIIETRHEPDLDFPVAEGMMPFLKVCVVKFA
jgi:23S rRNA G2069 N7-methylase RlmK/C1962 C5-methylase RlmI